MEERKKYYPFKSDKPIKKFYIITNDNKKVYFGASGYEHFTEGHLDERRKLVYIYHVIEKMKTGKTRTPVATGVCGFSGIQKHMNRLIKK